MEMVQLKELASLITNVGLAIVCSAVLIIFCIAMFKRQQKMIDTLTQALNRKEHPSEEDTDLLGKINEKIYDEILGDLSALDADRVFVYLYHNGGVSSSGLFFQRMSCICEVVNSGVLPVSDKSQSLYKGTYATLCKSLADTGEWIVEDTEDLSSVDGFLYQRLVADHTESAYYKVLKDSQGRPVGFVGVDYCSINEQISTSMIMDVLTSSSYKIASLVDMRADAKK